MRTNKYCRFLLASVSHIHNTAIGSARIGARARPCTRTSISLGASARARARMCFFGLYYNRYTYSY